MAKLSCFDPDPLTEHAAAGKYQDVGEKCSSCDLSGILSVFDGSNISSAPALDGDGISEPATPVGDDADGSTEHRDATAGGSAASNSTSEFHGERAPVDSILAQRISNRLSTDFTMGKAGQSSPLQAGGAAMFERLRHQLSDSDDKLTTVTRERDIAMEKLTVVEDGAADCKTKLMREVGEVDFERGRRAELDERVVAFAAKAHDLKTSAHRDQQAARSNQQQLLTVQEEVIDLRKHLRAERERADTAELRVIEMKLVLPVCEFCDSSAEQVRNLHALKENVTGMTDEMNALSVHNQKLNEELVRAQTLELAQGTQFAAIAAELSGLRRHAANLCQAIVDETTHAHGSIRKAAQTASDLVEGISHLRRRVVSAAGAKTPQEIIPEASNMRSKSQGVHRASARAAIRSVTTTADGRRNNVRRADVLGGVPHARSRPEPAAATLVRAARETTNHRHAQPANTRLSSSAAVGGITEQGHPFTRRTTTVPKPPVPSRKVDKPRRRQLVGGGRGRGVHGVDGAGGALARGTAPTANPRPKWR